MYLEDQVEENKFHWHAEKWAYKKLNLQRSTVSWRLFSGLFINAVMTVHASSIAEYGRVAISNNFTLGSGITQYAFKNEFRLIENQYRR